MTCTYQRMPPQGRHICEGSLTSPAFVWLFSCVNTLVTPQGSLLSKRFSTLLTRVRRSLWKDKKPTNVADSLSTAVTHPLTTRRQKKSELPAWIFLCWANEALSPNVFPHTSHLYGFAPVWQCLWHFKYSLVAKCFPHTSHLKRRSPIAETKKQVWLLITYTDDYKGKIFKKPFYPFGILPKLWKNIGALKCTALGKDFREWV